LEPDVCDRIEQLHAESKIQSVIVQPIGFVSDHMEVLYDLDEEAAAKAKELGIQFVRAPSVGLHPAFISMVVDLIEERLTPGTSRVCIGNLGPSHDICPVDCCLYPQPARPGNAGQPGSAGRPGNSGQPGAPGRPAS